MMMCPVLGLSSPIRHLRKTDLPVPEGPSRTLTSPGWQRERHVLPDSLVPEGLAQSLDGDLDSQNRTSAGTEAP